MAYETLSDFLLGKRVNFVNLSEQLRLGDGSFLVHTFWSPNEPRMMALINYALKNAGLPTNASSANSQATMG